MKILYIALIAVLAIPQFSNAQQWTTSGNNINNSNTGNVGIGTTSPNAILSILSPSLTLGTRNPIITAQEGFITEGGVYNTVETTSPFGWGLAFDTYKTNVGQIEAMRINNAGYIGIGTTSPASVLDVKGPSGITGFTGTSRLGLTIRSAGSGDYTGIDFGAVWGGADNPLARIGMITTFTGSKLQFGTSNNYATGITNAAMTIDQTGNVAIGTTDPQGYMLAVNGSVIATSVTVKLQTSWPDYVFKPNYKLPSLLEVKTYIDKNQHLPEVPSEIEVTKKGINLGEMNKVLVKKVEELTLYLIDKDKQLADQQKQIDELKQQSDIRITALEKALSKSTL